MRKKLLTFLCVYGLSFTLSAQALLYPVIKDYGGVEEDSFAVVRPDPAIDYKIVAEMGEPLKNKSQVYGPLEVVARLYNLHIYGGVTQKNLHVAAVIYAGGTLATLNNEEYRKRFGIDNPNVKLIRELKDAGIEIIVCGQSVMKDQVDPTTINPDVEIATSRLTAVSTFQMKGYGFFIF
jgi:intracellular sulfur oxidation DsrE/DsrF family protein